MGWDGNVAEMKDGMLDYNVAFGDIVAGGRPSGGLERDQNKRRVKEGAHETVWNLRRLRLNQESKWPRAK